MNENFETLRGTQNLTTLNTMGKTLEEAVVDADDTVVDAGDTLESDDDTDDL